MSTSQASVSGGRLCHEESCSGAGRPNDATRRGGQVGAGACSIAHRRAPEATARCNGMFGATHDITLMAVTTSNRRGERP